MAPGRHLEGVFSHTKGVVAASLEAKMTFETVCVQPGDVVLFDSYLPHRSDANTSSNGRRLAYLTFSPASEVRINTKTAFSAHSAHATRLCSSSLKYNRAKEYKILSML